MQQVYAVARNDRLISALPPGTYPSFCFSTQSSIDHFFFFFDSKRTLVDSCHTVHTLMVENIISVTLGVDISGRLGFWFAMQSIRIQ
jgi:hypothetical protein